MGTRSIIVLKDKYNENYIYIHWDGYPSNRLVELQEFLKWNTSRNNDLAYATANFIFWYKLSPYEETSFDAPTVIKNILKPIEADNEVRRGISIVNSKHYDYEYEYVVDFDTRTIRVTGHERDVTVAFGQVVKFDDDDEIIEAQIPTN